MTTQFLFGTVGAPTSTPKKPGGSVGAIQEINRLGLAALELGWVRAVQVTEATCLAIKTEAKTQGIALSVHAPYYINLNADDDEWRKSRKRLMDSAHFGNLAGATAIVFHPGSYFGQDAEIVQKKAIHRLEGCLSELRDAGNPVMLRPETMGKSAMLGSLNDTLVISRALAGVEPCLDFAHLHARAGDGSWNTGEAWLKALDSYAQALGEDALQRLHIHMSGIEYTGKGEKNHLPLQESDFNLIALFEALKERHCRGRILCESPILEEDALYMQGVWRDKFGD